MKQIKILFIKADINLLFKLLSLIIFNFLVFKFQGFNWESWRRQWYQELAFKAADLSHSGITAVWLPPPTESVAPQGKSPIVSIVSSTIILFVIGILVHLKFKLFYHLL